jgi:hypothetical protein
MSNKTETSQEEIPTLVKDWRFYLGIGALALSIIMPVFSLFVPLLGLSVAQSALVAAILIGGGPEVMALHCRCLAWQGDVPLSGAPSKELFPRQGSGELRLAGPLLPRAYSKYRELDTSLFVWIPSRDNAWWKHENLYFGRGGLDLCREHVRYGW